MLGYGGLRGYPSVQAVCDKLVKVADTSGPTRRSPRAMSSATSSLPKFIPR